VVDHGPLHFHSDLSPANHRALVAEYAQRRNSTLSDQFDVKIVNTNDYPFFAVRERQRYVKGSGTCATVSNAHGSTMIYSRSIGNINTLVFYTRIAGFTGLVRLK
jgi:hypothetical protein